MEKFGSEIFCGQGVGDWAEGSAFRVGSLDFSGGSSYISVYSVF